MMSINQIFVMFIFLHAISHGSDRALVISERVIKKYIQVNASLCVREVVSKKTLLTAVIHILRTIITTL